MIRIAQYKGRSFTSGIIKFVTRGEYSHTAIMLDDGRIIEAWQGDNKVRIMRSLSDGHKPGTPVDIYELPMNANEELVFKRYILGKVGIKYDYLGLLAFFLNKKAWDRVDRSFCSKLFYAAYVRTGKRLFADDVEPWQVSPSMITRTAAPILLKSVIT